MSRAEGQQQALNVQTLAGMRALAHPTRIRIKQMLSQEELSASEVAKRLGIRVGSAQFHIGRLVNAGIAHRAGTRSQGRRQEILFAVRAWTNVLAPPGTPAALRQAVTSSYVSELVRLLEERGVVEPSEHDFITVREFSIPSEGVATAARLTREYLFGMRQLEDGAKSDPSGHRRFALGIFVFTLPDSAER